MIIDLLKQQGVVKEDRATATPLTGGVSCEIFLVEDGEKKYVAKRALAKLNVKEDWYANTSRNIYEQRYLKYVGEKFPIWVPDILQSFEDQNLFIMEFFPERFKDWKKALIKREINPAVAQEIGLALGSIHKMSWGDSEAKKWFDSDQNFHELRVSPYFEFMRGIHPELKERIDRLSSKLMTNKQCLVHGDFSPKNILVSGTEIKIVDCEVAWYGDPVFDIGFMLHHLFIKSIHFNNPGYLGLANSFMLGYRNSLGEDLYTQIEQSHVCEMTLMLMLARIDGKSPVEYLSGEEKEQIREQVKTLLQKEFTTYSSLLEGVRGNEN